MRTTDVFKICPCCEKSWKTRDEFLADDSLNLNGYQVSLKNLESGLLLFSHMIEGCKTTMGIYIKEFNDMYSGGRYTENKALTEECPRYCINKKRLDRCNTFCECAYVREIIHIVKNIRTMKS